MRPSRPRSDAELVEVFAEARRLFTCEEGRPIIGSSPEGITATQTAVTIIVGAETILREKLRKEAEKPPGLKLVPPPST